jgi:hypothetical protein
MFDPSMLQMVQQFKQNPLGFLLQRRLNVPPNVTNDPNAILNYLLSTGQVNQNQINMAYQTLQNGGMRR